MNYNDMTNAELDQLSAERFGEYNEKTNIVSFGNCKYLVKDEIYLDPEWLPTSPDSNQARQYLIPRVFNKDPDYLHYEVLFEMGDWYVQWSNPSEDWEVRVDVDFEDEANINNENRAVVIACLEAWDRLEQK